MWFVFPQLRGLGVSPTAQFYGVASVDEARAYLAHPMLGDRLKRCVEATVAVQGRTLHQIFGSPDDMKFRSSMTLFELTAEGSEPIFAKAIETLCGGQRDDRTLDLAKCDPSA